MGALLVSVIPGPFVGDVVGPHLGVVGGARPGVLRFAWSIMDVLSLGPSPWSLVLEGEGF